MSVEIVTVHQQRCARLLCGALFNKYHVKAGFLASQVRDTQFDYLLSTEDKLRKAVIEEIRNFAKGFAECWRVLT